MQHPVRIARLLPACLLLAAAPAPLLRSGDYCFDRPVATASGEPIGTFHALVSIRGARGKRTIRFTDGMPPTDEVVITGTVPLEEQAGRPATFRFTDNWGAAGRGTVRPAGRGVVVSIERLGSADTSWGNNAGHNYGKFELPPGTCHRIAPGDLGGR